MLMMAPWVTWLCLAPDGDVSVCGDVAEGAMPRHAGSSVGNASEPDVARGTQRQPEAASQTQPEKEPGPARSQSQGQPETYPELTQK